MSESEVVEHLARLEGWTNDSNHSISRSLQFGDHIEAMGFVNKLALAAEKMNHHPDLRIVYNTVEIVLSTHDAGGVTQKDIDLATQVERYR